MISIKHLVRSTLVPAILVSQGLHNRARIVIVFFFMVAFLTSGNLSSTPSGKVLVQLSERPALEVQAVKGSGVGGEKLVVLVLHPAEGGNELVRYNVDLETRVVETIPLPALNNSFSLGNAYLLFDGRILGVAVDFDRAGFAFTLQPDGTVEKQIVAPENIYAADLACPDVVLKSASLAQPALVCPTCGAPAVPCSCANYKADSNNHDVFTSENGTEWEQKEVSEPAGNLDDVNGGTGAALAPTKDGQDFFLTYTGRTEEASNPGFLVDLFSPTGEEQILQGPHLARPRFFNSTYGADSESTFLNEHVYYPVVNDDSIDLLDFDVEASQVTSTRVASHPRGSR